MPKSTKHAKAKKVVHPNSRKAHKAGAKVVHKEKVKKVHYETTLKQSVLQEKLLWMKDHIDEAKTSYSKRDLCELAEKYLKRFDEELEQINIIHGVGLRRSKQHAARESAIHLTLKKEVGEYETCGLEVPDLCDGRNLKLFKAWEGEIRYLQNIKLRRVKRNMNHQDSKNDEDEDGEWQDEDDEVIVELEEEDSDLQDEEDEEELDGRQDEGEHDDTGEGDEDVTKKDNT